MIYNDQRLYPFELFSANETQTQENMRRYDNYITRLYDTIEAEHPDYYSLTRQEKNAIRAEVEERLKGMKP